MTRPIAVAEAFAALIAQSHKSKPHPHILKAQAMTTTELKAAWDAFDGDAKEGEPGFFWPPDGPQIEDVHRVLNERGEGVHCAV
jgi:hypothetical protein